MYWVKVDEDTGRFVCELCDEPLPVELGEIKIKHWTNEDPEHHAAICDACAGTCETTPTALN